MTNYEVLVSRTAAKELGGLEESLQARIKEKLRKLTQGPSNRSSRMDVKKLSSTKGNYYRLRVAECRIIFLRKKLQLKSQE